MAIARTGAIRRHDLRSMTGRFVKAGGVIAMASTRGLAVIKPEMVTSDELTFNVMKAPVTVGMFKQFVKDEAAKPKGYRIAGHPNTGKLMELLADPGMSDQELKDLDYDNAINFVSWRKKRTGEDFRMPTEEEWLTATRELGRRLAGNSDEWLDTTYRRPTMTKEVEGGGWPYYYIRSTRILRSQGVGRPREVPLNKYSVYGALRLVQDKK